MAAGLMRALAALAVGCLILEAVLRWGLGFGDPVQVRLDPKLEYRLLPSTRFHRFGNLIDINSYGMRAPEHPAQAAPGERRVMIVGDSVVYGNHALDQTETIALQMTAALNAHDSAAACPFRVLPAAVSSWGPVNQAAFLEEVGLLDAELVLHVVSAHDLSDVPQNDGVIPYRLSGSWTALSDAARFVVERLRRRFAQTTAPMVYEARVALSLRALASDTHRNSDKLSE